MIFSRFFLSPIIPKKNDFCAQVPFDYAVTELTPEPDLAVICHMYYVDTRNEFARYLSNIPFRFNLYITTDTLAKKQEVEHGFSEWQGKIEVRIAENRGRDIAPMLVACRDVFQKHEYILHIHTKKSPHRGRLAGWRSYLLETLLGSREIVQSIFAAFKQEPQLGMIAPQHFPGIRKAVGWGKNFKIARSLAERMGIQLTRGNLLGFPSGSMFWARSAALRSLLDCKLGYDDFPAETGQLDGTLGHAVERLFFFSCEHSGYKWIKIGRAGLTGNLETLKVIKSPDDLDHFINDTGHRLINPP